MPARLIQLLALAAGLYGTGAMIVLLAPSVASRPAVAAASPGPAAAADAPPVLPAVVVRPEPAIRTLATVTVRPDDDGAAAPAEAATDALDVLAAHASSAVGLPGGGFDMPYYSFGKPLHRANRE